MSACLEHVYSGAGELPSEADGHFLAGFSAGEASFCIFPRRGGGFSCSFSIGLDPKDHAILCELRESLGGRGSLSSGSAVVSWSIRGWDDCAYLVRVFERFPLRGYKRHDFAIWADAVAARIAVKKRRANGDDWLPVAECYRQLCELRRGGDAHAQLRADS